MRQGILLLALLLAACGTEPPGDGGGGDDPPDGSNLIRVSLGVIGNEDESIFSLLMRCSRVIVKMSDGSDIVGSASNADVLRGALLLERRSDALPREVELRFEVPPDGSGVIPGDEVAVFVGGLIGSDSLEYYAEELESVRRSVTTPRIDLRFDVSGWLTGLTRDSFDSDPPYRVDADDDADDDGDIAALIELRIIDSLRVCGECD